MAKRYFLRAIQWQNADNWVCKKHNPSAKQKGKMVLNAGGVLKNGLKTKRARPKFAAICLLFGLVFRQNGVIGRVWFVNKKQMLLVVLVFQLSQVFLVILVFSSYSRFSSYSSVSSLFQASQLFNNIRPARSSVVRSHLFTFSPFHLFTLSPLKGLALLLYPMVHFA